ncbi:MAG: hydantoinase B/oxoprolinase family protein [Bacillati bacterium ANGP1]|uniref:Hydantoinase B/oxoprolinase family protein n=2 Tax=Candidatus Segetimicrobium genomatis TaxID=2569760 RepID=A0A537J422_9BACT|nr:MAG: hydantoinase B/oxoprolinase family protein [Terrabacteria group bacterium ANGP1]
MNSRTLTIDRITVSVLQHRFVAIVAEMGEAMLRTAYSQILNSSRDFSTALCDGQGRLVAQAEHVPIHVGNLPWAVRSVAQAFEGRIVPGDLYLLNDPYHGGNHLPDLTVLLPVFAAGRLVFWSLNRAHQSDIGGSTHGAYNPGATEIWQEGIRIPPLKLYDAGEVRDDVMQMIATNVRHSRDFLGDLRASIGSARLGERRLLRMVDEYGAETVAAAVEEILDSAERRTRACIRTWRDGVYRGEAVLDDDGHGATDIPIRATVKKSGDHLRVDLTESAPQVTGFVNSSYPNTMSAVFMAIAYLIDPDIPKNDGTFRPVAVRARQGTIVWPLPPAPVTLATNHCGQEIAEAVIKALAGACPDRALAGWSRRFRIALRGVDPQTGRPFIWHMFHARGGGGASAAGDGWPTVGEGQAAGGIKFGSVEVTEARFPLFLRTHEFRPGSGGAGTFRGGVGSVLEMRVEIDQSAVANTAGDGIRHAPYGLLRGQDGLPHRYRLISRSGTRWLRTKEVGIPVRPGDVFFIESSGGGGYGDPGKRDPRAHAADLRNGFVTARRGARRPRRPARATRPRRPRTTGGGRVPDRH